MIRGFEIGPVPSIVFGAGSRDRIPQLASGYGRRILLVTGARSLRASRFWTPLEDSLGEAKLAWLPLVVEGEPSPDLVDAAVREHRGARLDAVVSIGGGSVLDAAKAVAALLPSGRSVMDHLEGVGKGIPYTGPSLPLIAAPTTAGSGSEATRNAVLSSRGEGGFKKSFRHDALVAKWAVVDPDFLESCPKDLVAADGMDALTQLLEAYVSLRANPLTDALAESGLAAVRDGLIGWYEGTAPASAARARMAYAALASGIALAQTGLGAVHGLAAALGAVSSIPHAAACGTLLAATVDANVAAIRERLPESDAQARYARAYEILSARTLSARDPSRRTQTGCDRLVRLLREWSRRLDLRRLSRYGVSASDFRRVVATSRGGSMTTNPVVLEDIELEAILAASL